MDNSEFLKLVTRLISQASDVEESEVYVVWSCKTLQNNKALASTTKHDDIYYEITHNGDKNEVYLDCYKKQWNECVPANYERVY